MKKKLKKIWTSGMNVVYLEHQKRKKMRKMSRKEIDEKLEQIKNEFDKGIEGEYTIGDFTIRTEITPTETGIVVADNMLDLMEGFYQLNDELDYERLLADVRLFIDNPIQYEISVGSPSANAF